MKNKELRKQLETVLVNSLSATLTARNDKAGKKIEKTIKSAAKEIARKFYKALDVKKVAVKKKTSKKPAPPAKAKASARRK